MRLIYQKIQENEEISMSERGESLDGRDQLEEII